MASATTTSIVSHTGLRAAFLDPEDSALLCCDMCQKQLIDAGTSKTSCGHFVCQRCMSLLKDKVCLVCNAEFKEAFPVDPFLINIVESRKMRCLFPGCEWRGVYGSRGSEFGTHYNLCGFAPWKCPDCNQMLTRAARTEHALCCPQRKVTCEECKAEFGWNDKEVHCQVCPNAIVECAFGRYGCTNHIKRRDLNKHNVAAMDHHFRCLLARLEDNARKNEVLERQVQENTRKTELLERQMDDMRMLVTGMVKAASAIPPPPPPPPPAKRPRGRPKSKKPRVEVLTPLPPPSKDTPPKDAVVVDSPRRKIPRKIQDDSSSNNNDDAMLSNPIV